MSTVQETLFLRREQVAADRRTLHQSRGEVTGQALSRLLTTLQEASVKSLISATSIDDVRRLQGEIQAYAMLLDFQRKAPVDIQPNK